MSIRRLITLVFLVASVVGPVGVALPARAQAQDNPVVAENKQPGSGAWHLGNLVADDVGGQIKGYASATSVDQNAPLTLFISVNPAQAYSIDIFRVGWYSGLGGRLRLHQGGLTGIKQQACTPDPITGLIECGWTPSYTFSIPGDWTSGVYLALLTNSMGYESFIPFVVKDGRQAAFIYQQSVATDEAYNNYPDDHVTGKSLYPFNSYGANTVGGDARAVKVSFDRPYADNGAKMFFSWEIQLVRWLEESGYDVTYSTDVDTHANGGALLNYAGFISGGHDEYWSLPMYDAVQGARDKGVNLAFFGGDTLGWQARFEPSSTGTPNRVVVCYKDATIDPVQGPTTTVQWRSPLLNRPGQLLTGVTLAGEFVFNDNQDYVVANSSHWVYAGTGLKDGDHVKGIVGYEIDNYSTRYPAPASNNRTLLSSSPYVDSTSATTTYSNSSIYQAPSGAWVFASGTMSWSWALDNGDPTLADLRLQQATSNILNAFIYGAPVVNDLKVTAPATVTSGQTFTVSVVAENSRGNPVTQYGGTVHFASSDGSSPSTVLPPDSALTGGQGSFAVTLNTPGPQTLTVSDAANSLSTTLTLTVNPAPTTLVLSSVGPATATAGAAFTFTVTAEDQLGNPQTGYTGVVHFASSDTSPGAVLPADSTLTSGQGTFSATLVRAGAQTLVASDNFGFRSSPLAVTVTAAPATHLSLAVPASQVTAGASFTLGVTAQDQFGNTDPSYGGTVHFASSDAAPGVVVPADSTMSGGSGTFAATLIRAGAQTVTVTDVANGSITGGATVQVVAAAAATLTLSAPTSAVVNRPFSVVVTLYDPFGNVATGYSGTTHFASTDMLAQLPADYTFSRTDGGTHSFTVTLVTPMNETITVADTANSQLRATSPPIRVTLM